MMNQTIKAKLEELEAVIEEFHEDFRMVSKETIVKLRLCKKRFGLLKLQEKFYIFSYRTHGEVEKTEKIIKKIRACFDNVHCCANCANFYNEQQKSLCPKVEDGSEEVCRRYTTSDIEAITESKRLEKYPFITIGFEEVNIPEGRFIVLSCTNYEKEKADTTKKSQSMLVVPGYYESKESHRVQANIATRQTFKFYLGNF